MDSCIIPLNNKYNLSLVQSVDFFYPIIDDPYLTGKITFSNVVSDIYAIGITNIDKIQIIISTSNKFTDNERNIIIPLIINGFKDAAKTINCIININEINININPWCIVGGIATSIINNNELLMLNNAKLGDLIILTKPLGTQIGTAVLNWLNDNTLEWNKLKMYLTNEDILKTYNLTVNTMCDLNLIAGKLLNEYKCTASTDITGFGLYGHAMNLINFQKNLNIKFLINKLPIINNVYKIAKLLNKEKKLLSGNAVETSGGLLLCIPYNNANDFLIKFQNETKRQAWIIGEVVTGERTVEILQTSEIINVE